MDIKKIHYLYNLSKDLDELKKIDDKKTFDLNYFDCQFVLHSDRDLRKPMMYIPQKYNHRFANLVNEIIKELEKELNDE